MLSSIGEIEMRNHIPKIKALHRAIEKTLFYRNPPLTYAKTVQALNLLARLISDYPGDNDDWIYIGECSCISLDSLLVAAYWHLSHWYSGQWSDEYRALCAIGEIFSPGMSSEPVRGGSEYHCYKALDATARREAGLPVYSFYPLVLR
jgi:hypothetical protein